MQIGFVGIVNANPGMVSFGINRGHHTAKALEKGYTFGIAHVTEDILTDDLPDVEKMKPVVFSMYDNRYWGLGNLLGKGWNKGLHLISSLKKYEDK